MTSLEGQLVNSRAPEIAIYLRTYFKRVLSSLVRNGVNSLRARSALVLREQTALIVAWYPAQRKVRTDALPVN